LFLDAARTASDWGPAAFPTGPPLTASHFADWQEAEAWLDAAGGELVDVVGHAAALGEADHACWIAEALCDYFMRRGRYHESQTALEIALAHEGEATDRRMAAAVRNCLMYTAGHQRNFEVALTYATEALDLGRRLCEPGEEARALAGLGTVHLRRGDGDGALPHLLAAVDLSRQLRNDWLTWITLLFLGLAHQLEGRDTKALACFDDACTHAEKAARPHMLGRALSCAADAHLHFGHYGEAKRLLRRAIDQVLHTGDAFLCARSLTRLGTAEEAEGDPETAIAVHHQALLLQRRLMSPLTEPNYDWLEMDIRSRLGSAYAAAGRPREASREFRAVLDLPGARTQPAGGRGRR
ncbi:tetratricopeptide repeat protein, partial [Streptomyces sp. NPDC056121]|uniref:tetratricopeptide repeat protein n=1 Tax=Streptomyces sp. NPDC056121 TaxID=3345718 RepID=UPI0035E06A24